METEYGIDVFGSINCKFKFLKVMRNLCGKKATITDKYKEMISLTFDDIKENNGWTFSTDMIELDYPTVRGYEVKEKVMKEKLKVGDRVIAIKKVGNKHKKNVYGILKEDDGSYNRRYLVEFDTDIGGNTCGKNYWWCNADEIKKVVIDEVKSTKFKVGDIIIGNDKNRYTYTAKGVKCKVICHLKDDLFSDIKVKILDGDRVRKLTPRECWKLMGFTEEDFEKVNFLSNTQLYKQAGNSICVPMLESVLNDLIK